jgi:Holliday junction resolvasome RuvABC endonuclease subunit
METLLDRYARLRDLSAGIVHHAAVADLVVIEGLIASPSRDRGAFDRPALWWIVVGALCRRNVPVAVASPTAMKRVIVGPRPKGSGPVDKVEVALAVQKLWPGVELGNNDTADAAGLAHCGAVAMDMAVSALERHRTMVWTEYPDITSAGAEVA